MTEPPPAKLIRNGVRVMIMRRTGVGSLAAAQGYRYRRIAAGFDRRASRRGRWVAGRSPFPATRLPQVAAGPAFAGRTPAHLLRRALRTDRPSIPYCNE